MKSTNHNFYGSKKWQRERQLYKQSHPFCERCLSKGLYKPVEIVHHKEHLTEEKSKDARIALNFSNLESLCLDCHNKEHFEGKRSFGTKRRYVFSEHGLIIRDI